MTLRCVRKYSNLEPGDTVEVPDGVAFDHYYFEEVEPKPKPKSTSNEKAEEK